MDNCPAVTNADQLDTDRDGQGDACDLDKDGDGVSDDVDNCPIVPNSDQLDSNSNGVGDVCENDSDGDGIPDDDDVCPLNNGVERTDFRGIQAITMGAGNADPPVWEFNDGGREIVQKVNSLRGIAIGGTKLAAVEFEGTIFVGKNNDNDMIGAIFSYQVFQ